MIVELGHFALILALPSPSCRWRCRPGARASRDARLMAVAEPAALAPARPARRRLPRAHPRLRHVRLLGRERVGQLAFDQAAALQDLRRVGEPRRLDAAVGADPRRCSAPPSPLFGSNLPPTLKANVLAVQASIAVAFLALHPAHLQPVPAHRPPPADGRGLNPILQDPALAFHPPFLYTGYVGFSIAFSFAIAALIEGRIDAAWARWVRPWTLAAWMCLTIGIAMGSWWAYYELGWGGWWFWDPVENASFMPWLAGTALLHSAARHGEARGAEGVDDPARHPHLLAVADGHLPGALGRAHLGARLRRRSAGAASSSSPSWRCSPAARWRSSPGARRDLRAGRPVRADQPRGRARAQQHPADVGLRHRARRHALSAGCSSR